VIPIPSRRKNNSSTSQRLEDELEEQSLELKECEADLFASNTKCKALARSLKDERAKGRAERGDEDVGVEEELERLRIEYAKCKDDLSYCEEELEEARAEAEEFKKVMMDSELKQQQANRESLDEIARLKRLVSSLQANQREGAGRGLEGDLDEAPSGDLDANSNGLDLISAPSNQGQGQGQGLDEAAIQERVRRLNSQLQTCKERACALLHDEI
jgi:chromosome segregation ATPase